MAKPAILCLLATLSLFSGCLGDGSDPAPSADEVPLAEATAVETAPAPVVPVAPPKCPVNHSNNYGSSFNLGGEYIYSPSGSDLLVYYRESNGCSGMQTEAGWPHNPDTKVVEVPYPIVFGSGAPAAKA
jgi:hypothetical protein